MNSMKCSIASLFFIFFLSNLASAQEDTLQLRIEGDDVRVRILRDINSAALDSLLCSYGTCMSEMDSLWKSQGKTTNFGWKLDQFLGDWIELHKPVSSLSGSLNTGSIVALENSAIISSENTRSFGYNNFKNPSIEELANGKTRFTLDEPKAHSVYLAGTFNGWSTLQTPMKLVNNVWVAEFELAPGRHEYKFIVDGQWQLDKNNRRKQSNDQGTFNSIYFKPNTRFRLMDFQEAKKVILAGSFNDWNENSLRMEATKLGWEVDVFLPEGTYTYKFIVDGEWMVDPINPSTRDNGMGSVNSVLTIGEPTIFNLNQFLSANTVVLSGSFNGWNEQELQMTKGSQGWEISIALQPGMYEYKYLIDGKWALDPANPVKIGEGDYTNSVFAEEPNKHFSLEGYQDAQSVICTGSFNGWSESGYTMVKTARGWELDLKLNHGKYAYKFIVDGKWIIDPSNPLYEPNEFDNYNSIVWIE